VSRLAHLARILLAALLLAAQQAALEHAIWHAGSAQSASTDASKTDPGRNPLCEQHGALGEVLGGIGCAATPLVPVVHEFAALPAPLLPARDNAPLVSAARDPPVRL
jgi:hypothetical protein